MAHGAQDYWLRTITEALMADALKGGADAAKPAVPSAGDIWWAHDTKILYICATSGAWTGLDAATLVQGTIIAALLAGRSIADLGTKDHDLLDGLADDDHTQYLKEKASGGLAAETPVHTHQAAGECGKLDHGLALNGLGDDDHPQYIVKAGDFGLGTDFRRAVEDGYLILRGGLTWGAYIQLLGKDHATAPGEIILTVPNAGKTGTVECLRFSGVTDTPEMTAGIIPQARGKLGDGFPYFKTGTYTGNGVDTGRQITTGFACKLVILRNQVICSESFDAFSTTHSLRHRKAQAVDEHELNTYVHLHATDGFVVGDGAFDGNLDTEVYYYTAFG